MKKHKVGYTLLCSVMKTWYNEESRITNFYRHSDVIDIKELEEIEKDLKALLNKYAHVSRSATNGD